MSLPSVLVMEGTISPSKCHRLPLHQFHFPSNSKTESTPLGVTVVRGYVLFHVNLDLFLTQVAFFFFLKTKPGLNQETDERN